ncbi:MAG: PHP domain-containing protein [Candidatus Aminicenantes bacterium]|nr:PHP domain-containing protein [Candidatus Aminicenantes bacterium]
MALRRIRADLHIHSCLSPCGDLSIYPRRIVERASAAGIGVVGVCDHNTAGNAAAVINAARGSGLTVLPGMEIASEEEVHVLGLFPSLAALRPLEEEIARDLPRLSAKEAARQDQVLVGEDDEVLGFHPLHLLGATRRTLSEIVELIHRRGGLAIAAHIDREAFSIVSQLGFIPPGLAIDALEVSPLTTIARARETIRPPARFPLVRFSDAHRPEEIGRATTDFLLAAPTFEEIRMALKAERGRRVCRP